MENVNKTQAVELTMEQMSQLVVDGLLKREIVKVGSPDEVDLNVNVNYKGEQTDKGFVLTGCIIQIEEKPKPKFVDVNSII